MSDRRVDAKSIDRLIIGLDFGTTFSGIAYSFAKQGGKKVNAIMDWVGMYPLTMPATKCLMCLWQARRARQPQKFPH